MRLRARWQRRNVAIVDTMDAMRQRILSSMTTLHWPRWHGSFRNEGDTAVVGDGTQALYWRSGSCARSGAAGSDAARHERHRRLPGCAPTPGVPIVMLTRQDRHRRRRPGSPRSGADDVMEAVQARRNWWPVCAPAAPQRRRTRRDARSPTSTSTAARHKAFTRGGEQISSPAGIRPAGGVGTQTRQCLLGMCCSNRCGATVIPPTRLVNVHVQRLRAKVERLRIRRWC